MTKENEKSADAAEAASASEPNNPETQNPAADAPTDSGSEPVNETSVDEAPVDEAPAEPTAEEQIAALNDQLLRTLAELENTRRRAERDRAREQNRAELHHGRQPGDGKSLFIRAENGESF